MGVTRHLNGRGYNFQHNSSHHERVCLAYCSDYLGSGEFYSDSPIFTVTALDYYLLFRGGDVVVVGGVLDARPPR